VQWVYRLDGPVFESKEKARVCFSANRSDRLWSRPSLLLNGYRGYSPGVQRSGHEVARSPPTNTEVKNERSGTCIPPAWFYGVDRDNFTFYIKCLLSINCVFYFSSQLHPQTSHLRVTWSLKLSDVHKTEAVEQNFVKIPNIRFHNNPLSGSEAASCTRKDGRTDGRLNQTGTLPGFVWLKNGGKKGNVPAIFCHGGTEKQACSPTLSLTSAPAALPPGMTRHSLYRRVSGLESQSGRAQKISSLGFDPRTVQPVPSEHTDYAKLARKEGAPI
jgi:hypothetical protein